MLLEKPTSVQIEGVLSDLRKVCLTLAALAP